MNEFTCINCKKTYFKRNDIEWNAFKAIEEFFSLYPELKNNSTDFVSKSAEEFLNLHPELKIHSTDILCSKCNKIFKEWFSELTEAYKEKIRKNNVTS